MTQPMRRVLDAVDEPLLLIADRLFGGSEPEPGPSRRWWLRYLAVATSIAAVIIVRRSDAVTNPQFWGEDGYIFFFENLTLGFVGALLKTYHGFPYVIHRLIAFAGGLVPIAEAPRVYTSSAIVVTASGLALFALPHFRHVVRNDGLRALFGVVVVSLPFRWPLLSNPANLGWFIAIWLTLISLMRLGRRPARVGLMGLGACLAVASTPLAIVNLPLWLLRAWRGWRQADRRELLFASALIAVLALLLTVTRGMGRDARFPLLQRPIHRAEVALDLGNQVSAALVVPPERLTAARESYAHADAGLTGLIVALLLAASAIAGFRNLSPLVAAVLLAYGALFVSILGRPILVGLTALSVPARYSVFSGAMMVLAVIVALDGLPAGWTRRGAGVCLAAIVAWTWTPAFLLKPFADHEWHRWAAELQAKLESKSRMPLAIPLNPPWARLEFDPLDMAPDVHVIGSAVLASLGTQGTFRQEFVSRCDRLSAVQIWLGTGAPSIQGRIRMTLLDHDDAVVVQQDIPRIELPLDGSSPLVVFEPIQGSVGKTYTLVLTAAPEDGAAAVSVPGERGDPYTDGQAISNRRVLDGDASVRYGCARSRER